MEEEISINLTRTIYLAIKYREISNDSIQTSQLP